MIKINDDFSIEHDPQSWRLYEYRDGVNPKTQEPIRSKKVTYHSSLAQMCRIIIDRSAGRACEAAGDIVAAIQAAERDIFQAIHANPDR